MMSDVGTTHEDLERFLAEHHLVGAGLRRDGRAPARQGNTAAHWSTIFALPDGAAWSATLFLRQRVRA